MIRGLTEKHFDRNIGRNSSIDTALRRKGFDRESRAKISEHLFNSDDRRLKEIIGKDGIHAGNLDKVMDHLKEHSGIGLNDREMRHLREGLEDRIHAVVAPSHSAAADAPHVHDRMAANDNAPHVHDRAA